MGMKPVPMRHSQLADIGAGVGGKAHKFVEVDFGALSLPNNAFTLLDMTSAITNEDPALFEIDTTNDMLRIHEHGVYLIEARVTFDASAVGLRGMLIDTDNLGVYQRSVESASPTLQHVMSRSLIIFNNIAAGSLPLDVTLFGFQTSGGALNARTDTRLRAYKLGPILV